VELAILRDVFAFVVGIVGMGCITGILVTWIKWRGGRQKSPAELVSRLDEISERIGRLDTAVDAVAVEIERISEAQRFTSRILAERAGGTVLPDKARAPGSSTSH
jgi:hypothetical protein